MFDVRGCCSVNGDNNGNDTKDGINCNDGDIVMI